MSHAAQQARVGASGRLRFGRREGIRRVVIASWAPLQFPAPISAVTLASRIKRVSVRPQRRRACLRPRLTLFVIFTSLAEALRQPGKLGQTLRRDQRRARVIAPGGVTHLHCATPLRLVSTWY